MWISKAPVPLSQFRRRKCHGFDPGLTVMKPAYFRHSYDSPTVELRCDNGATTATTDNLRKRYGCIKEVPRISHGSLRLCYEFATALLRATVSPEVIG